MTACQTTATRPIYVDLDGTLISTDMLWESLCLLIHQHPFELLRLPLWLTQGKASFKQRIAERVSVSPDNLPYRPEVTEYLQEQRRLGHEVVLATASHHSIAAEIANHLGIFDHVLASDAQTNLKAGTKLRAIQSHSGGRPFEYLGDSSADVPIWQHAERAVLVAPSRAAEKAATQLREKGVETHELPTATAGWRPALRAIRAHQWSKNALLFVPLLLAHEFASASRLFSVAVAFVCFCAIASATYLLNDLLDIEADRQHPRKRLRPFAAGTLAIPHGIALIAGLILAGFGTSLALLSLQCTGMLALYLVSTLAYSLYFKKLLFVDVLLLAGLYTLRVLTGAVAAQVPVSTWLLAFSTFFFLSLALTKRYTELLSAKSSRRQDLARRGYLVDDLPLVETMGITSGYLSVLVVCLYVSSADVARLYPNPRLLWLTSPILLFWITRMWFLARRGVVADDPVFFAVTDRTSYVAAGLIAAVGLLAAY